MFFSYFILSVKRWNFSIFVRRCVRQTALTRLAILTFFLQKESNKEKLFSFQILPLFEARRLITAPALRSGLYEAFKAALPHASSLQPTSLLGRLKGVDTPACAHFAFAREPLLSSRRWPRYCYSGLAYILYSKSTLFFFEKVEGFREAEKSFLLLIKKKVFPPSWVTSDNTVYVMLFFITVFPLL